VIIVNGAAFLIPKIYPTRYDFRFKIFDLFVSWRGEATMNSGLL